MDEYPIIDLSHLLPAAQGLARLPADERIQRIRADRWIGYSRAVEGLNRLETLYAWPNKQRMPNLLLVGPTNNGKSMIIEKFRRSHPASSDADQEHIPVLVVQMPSEPSVIRFYVALLAAMGAPLRTRPRLPEMEQLALALLRQVGVRMLVIDELHNVLAGNSVNRREFLNLLRFLGNELRIRCCCRYGRPTTIAAHCWPASRLRSRCGDLLRLPRQTWPATCSPAAKAPLVNWRAC